MYISRLNNSYTKNNAAANDNNNNDDNNNDYFIKLKFQNNEK